MSDANSPEVPQIPKSSGGLPYILGALVLAAVGGVAFWLTREEPAPPPPPPAPAPSASAPAEPETPAIRDSIPPPPPVEEVAEPEPEPAKPASPSKAADLCGGPCKGSASAGLTSALSARASASRACYERALRGNETIQGRLVVQVRVDSNGRVCSARVAEDGLGSQEVSSCVLGNFRGVKLPAPTGGCVDVNVPMSFVPRGG